ncbi:MAG: helix-turn-helix domain-containing protein [Methanomicrobiaceae archaeon]|nr:helix-turn-helix domain-containing protein [Methanomicrobiaceae archaeon]
MFIIVLSFMCRDTESCCPCAAGGILARVAKKWALLIINRLGSSGRVRFTDLMTGVEGINPQALSATLRELLEEGLIGRESFAEIPPRVEYFLTPEGDALREAILPLLRWASLHDVRDPDRCAAVCRRRSGNPRGSPCAQKQHSDDKS